MSPEPAGVRPGAGADGPAVGTGNGERVEDMPPFELGRPGPLRERLCGLVLGGVKRGCFTLAVLDEIHPEDVLPPGTRARLVSSTGAALGVVEVEGRSTLRLADVSFDLVATEGEGDRSVAAWRAGHEAYWSHDLDEVRAHTGIPDWSIGDGTDVVYESFRLVERLPAADEGRYPVVELTVPADEVELAVSDLDDLGTLGVEELGVEELGVEEPGTGAVGLRAGFPSDAAAAFAERSLPWHWSPRLEVIVGDDWLDAWREHLEPMRVGRVVVAPAWRAADPAVADHPVVRSVDPGRGDVLLWLEPGRSFGTGGHPSTRLVLETLQGLPLADASVLDVGCGSGVLGVAAAMLGAGRVEGVDIEPPALRAFLDNATRNGVADRCRARHTDLARVADAEGFDVVLANILAPVLVSLAPLIAARRASDGVVVLAGLITDQIPQVLAAFAGLEERTRTVEEPWVCLVLGRPSEGLRSPGTS